jgi:hypothetical protein
VCTHTTTKHKKDRVACAFVLCVCAQICNRFERFSAGPAARSCGYFISRRAEGDMVGVARRAATTEHCTTRELMVLVVQLMVVVVQLW